MRDDVQRSVTGAEIAAQHQTHDVIVIGAGWSGLMACKYCVAEGLRTLVLEGRDSFGGVWTFTPDQRVGG